MELLSTCSRYVRCYEQALEGDAKCLLADRDRDELFGGARISYIFTEIFGSRIASIDALDDLTDADVLTAIRNANGARNSIFVPEVTFELLVRKQIARLEQPGLQCIDLVFEELQKLASQCSQKCDGAAGAGGAAAAAASASTSTSSSSSSSSGMGPDVHADILRVTYRLLHDRVRPTQEIISSIIKMELAHIGYNHPDFADECRGRPRFGGASGSRGGNGPPAARRDAV